MTLYDRLYPKLDKSKYCLDLEEIEYIDKGSKCTVYLTHEKDSPEKKVILKILSKK